MQTWAPKVVGKQHLKFFLEQKGRTIEGIGFNLGPRKSQLKKNRMPLRLVFTPQVNMFLNKPSIQIHVKDFRIAFTSPKER
jgi:single-stranded-DNA-specific exonuclease